MDCYAKLSNDKEYTVFSYGDVVLRFRNSKNLKRYVAVKQWDNGYLVVDADYDTMGVVEEYIDVSSVLDDLLRDREKFLASIKGVEVCYE